MAVVIAAVYDVAMVLFIYYAMVVLAIYLVIVVIGRSIPCHSCIMCCVGWFGIMGIGLPDRNNIRNQAYIISQRNGD